MLDPSVGDFLKNHACEVLKMKLGFERMKAYCIEASWKPSEDGKNFEILVQLVVPDGSDVIAPYCVGISIRPRAKRIHSEWAEMKGVVEKGIAHFMEKYGKKLSPDAEDLRRKVEKIRTKKATEEKRLADNLGKNMKKLEDIFSEFGEDE
jgi:hypothetical protein